MSTRESGSSTQSTGTSWMRRPRRWASTSSSVSKNQPSSRTSASRPPGRVARHGLEAALRVGEARAQHRVQQAVVGARDELALGPAHDARAERARRVPIARSLWPESSGATSGSRRAQVGRQVDVHVADDPRVAARPGRAQRAAAALALEAQELDAAAARARAPRAIAGVRVGARVVGDDDPPGEREARRSGSGAAGGCCARARPARCRRARRSRRSARACRDRPGACGPGAGERLLGHGHSVGARRGTTVGGG